MSPYNQNESIRIMLTLKSTEVTEKHGIKAHYELVDNPGGKHKTTLTQDLHLNICPETGRVTGELRITSLEGRNIEELTAQLARWCERLANAAREPMQVVTAVPVFRKDYEAERKLEEAGGPVGLTLVRLQERCRALGLSPEQTLAYANELFQADFITLPRTDVGNLPATARDDIDDILAAIEARVPGMAKGVVARPDSSLFRDPFPFTKTAIVPTAEDEDQHWSALSENAKAVFKVVAEAYLETAGARPAETPQEVAT